MICVTQLTGLDTKLAWYSYDYGDLIKKDQKTAYGNGDESVYIVSPYRMKHLELTDHLGNVLVTVRDRKTGHKPSGSPTSYDYWKPDVYSSQDYYPFGMQMPSRHLSNAANYYRFGYNGQMKEENISADGMHGVHNTAMFWEYDTRLARRWNTDPRPSSGMSPYATFGNNPIVFSDIAGDSVNVNGLYAKNDDGSYKSPGWIQAFELFASTANGKKYIMDHAQKGFKLQGVFVCDLDIEATAEGALSKNGVDVSYSVGDVNNKNAGGHASPSLLGGSSKSTGARLKTSIVLPIGKYSFSDELWNSGIEPIVYKVQVLAHESFLHENLFSRRFLNNNTDVKANDHADWIFANSDFSKLGMSTIKRAQTLLIDGNNIRAVSDINIQLMMDIGRGAYGTQKYNFKTHQEYLNFREKNR